MAVVLLTAEGDTTMPLFDGPVKVGGGIKVEPLPEESKLVATARRESATQTAVIVAIVVFVVWGLWKVAPHIAPFF